MHPLAPSAASRARSESALANTSHDGGGGAGIAFGGPAGDVFSSTSAASCAAAPDPALVSVAGIGSPMPTAAGWLPSETPAYIGRASWWERVCASVLISGVDVSLKKQLARKRITHT